MAVPTIISMLITSLYNIADTYFVGQINTQSTAAVGIAFSVMFFIQAFGFFFGHGSGNYISRELGAKRRGNAVKMASTGFFLSLCMGCLMMVAGLLLLRPLSVLLGSTPTILPYTERYLGIVLLGAPFLMSSLTLNNQLRLQGNASYAMYGIVIGAVLNVVLDPFFIFTLDMGVTGAAVATVVGQVVSFVILLFMTHKGENIPISYRNFAPTWARCKEIFYGGSPSLSRQGLTSVATVMLNIAAGGYGDAAIAAMTVVNRILMFVFSIIVGLGQGFQPLCGFCYGAGLYDRLRKAFWYCVKVGTLFLLVFSIIGFVFSGVAIGIFRNDAEVVAIGTVALQWQLASFPLNASVMMGNMLLQTCRKPVSANLLAAARQGLFFIPLIVVLPHFFDLKGVEMCQTWSDVCAFLLTIPVVFHAFKGMKAPVPANEK